MLSVKKLLSIFGIVIAVVVLLSQLLSLPYENYMSLLSNVDGVGFEAETGLATDEKKSKVEVDSVLGFQKLGTNTYPEKRLNANSTIGFHLNISTNSNQEGEMWNQSARIINQENVIADKGLMENQATGSDSNMLRAGASIMKSKRRRPASISYMNSLVQQNSSISFVV